MPTLYVYEVVSLYADICKKPWFIIRGSGLTVEGTCYNKAVKKCFDLRVKRFEVSDSDIPGYTDIITIYT